MIPNPSTMADYLDLVDQAVFEAGDRVISEGDDEAEHEHEHEHEHEPDLDTSFATLLEQQLKALQASITDGSYEFADQDLPFMALVQRYKPQIPFAELLERINATHRGGLGS